MSTPQYIERGNVKQVCKNCSSKKDTIIFSSTHCFSKLGIHLPHEASLSTWLQLIWTLLVVVPWKWSIWSYFLSWAVYFWLVTSLGYKLPGRMCCDYFCMFTYPQYYGFKIMFEYTWDYLEKLKDECPYLNSLKSWATVEILGTGKANPCRREILHWEGNDWEKRLSIFDSNNYSK